MSSPRKPIKFLVNTNSSVILDIVPPSLQFSNFPEGGCWYAAHEYLIDKHCNEKIYQSFKTYAEENFNLEMQKSMAKLRDQTGMILKKLSEKAKQQAETRLKEEFKYTNASINKKIKEAKLKTINPRETPGIKTEMKYSQDEMEKGQITDEEYILHRVFLSEISKNLGMVEVNWAPENTFDELIAALRQVGPLMVCGHFGPEYYSAPPTLLTKKSGREIFSFPKGSANVTNYDDPAHAIHIIGFEKGKQNLVYYIDPAIHALTYKIYPTIYVMSEQLFRDNLYNIDNHAFEAGIARKNIAALTHPPYILAASDYGKIRQNFVNTQMTERDEVYQKMLDKDGKFFDYRSLIALSLLSKSCHKEYAQKLNQVEAEYVKTCKAKQKF